jgi:hypothetical protein
MRGKTTMPKLHDPELVCPLIAGETRPEGAFHFEKVFGTAFSIGGQNLFLTAGHSIETAQGEGTVALGVPHSGGLATCMADDVEVFRDYDVGIVRVKKPIQHIRAIPWRAEVNRSRDDVIAIGFPHGYDAGEGAVTYRGFKGHVVATYKYSQLAAKPTCHELSFQAPRGMSEHRYSCFVSPSQS